MTEFLSAVPASYSSALSISLYSLSEVSLDLLAVSVHSLTRCLFSITFFFLLLLLIYVLHRTER